VDIVNNLDSDSYENVYIPQGDNIRETEENDPVVSERITMSSSSDSSSEEVLQTQQDRGRKRISSTKCTWVISGCELEWERK
jgi:hypothetical protein